MNVFENLEKQDVYFCPICKSIIKLNLEKNTKINQEYNRRNKKSIQLILPSFEVLSQSICNNMHNYCFLCMNILDINNDRYNKLFIEIEKFIKLYEYTYIRLVVKFSSIFNIIFWYVYNFLSKHFNQNLNYIFECDTIRQIFINKYTQFFSQKLGLKFDNNEYNRDLDLIINFDLNDIIYQKFNECILSSIDLRNNINISEIKDNYILNKNTGRAIIKSLTNEICDPNILSDNISKFFSIKEISLNINLDYILSPIPIYISGNYIKLSREIGQTHFNRIFNISSVDEEIKKFFSNIFKNCEKNDFILSASGREDRNVRMLGSGRNFVYEISNAKKKFGLNFEKLNDEFNKESKLVKIKNLGISSKSEYNKLKKEENKKIKKYLAVIYISKILKKNEINNLIKDNLEIKQITPLRVLHQRALIERKKQIISLKEIEKINEHFFVIEIVASAGTYIKEFINGDFGRTYPNLGSLLHCECDILQLDVEDIFY